MSQRILIGILSATAAVMALAIYRKRAAAPAAAPAAGVALAPAAEAPAGLEILPVVRGRNGRFERKPASSSTTPELSSSPTAALSAN